ncbi:hypothetical protein BS78_01G509200 [Paspalum vaginatum]|nr:hypothetical protein BS78_01G509200 [Paspalum vaginatum]
MSKSSSRPESDPPVVDLEKGGGTKQEEEGQLLPVATAAPMDPRRAMCIKVTLDVFTVVYLLFFVGVTALLVRKSENWWDPLPTLAVFTPVSVWMLWSAAKWKDVTKHALRTDDCDHHLSTKLLGK